MKKHLHFLPLLFLFLGLAAFAAGCGEGAGEEAVEAPFEPEKLEDFAHGGSALFHLADGWTNGGVFNCTWSKNNAEFDGVMRLSVTETENGFYGAEYRSNDTFSYGRYSVSMKAAGCSGLISSFFTYTSDPCWDEIDIEFLGRDTTLVQFNYYTNGVGGHEYLYDLGFNAAEDFHEYAFLWEEDAITWYVDGAEVYKATENIPSHSGQIMMNVWNPTGADAWSGKLDPTSLPATAQYQWIDFSPI